MEEKKIVSREVKMNVAKGQEEQTQKLSYEDLNKACANLSQQNQQMQAYIGRLQQQMREMADTITAKRLDYLFKVIELSVSSNLCWKFDEDFVASCIKEIQEVLTISQEQSEQGSSEEG